MTKHQHGPTMTYLRDHWHDIRAGWTHYRYLRTWMRKGGNPDIDPV